MSAGQPGIFAIGVGAAKTGTHSLAAMFEDSLRAAHEPESHHLLRLVLGRASAKLTQSEFVAGVEALFRSLNLELNVCQINGFIVDTLVDLYPEAAYVLTVRDARSWVRSIVNHQVTRMSYDPAWQDFRELRFQPEAHPRRPEDRPLEKNACYSLDAYLSYWVRHNAGVIQRVPAGRLLIVPMAQLAREAASIAAFIGAGPAAANAEKGHVYSGDYIDSPLDEMNPDYVKDRIAFYTDRLLEQTLPLLPGRAAAPFREAAIASEAAL
jgi:Sulfotransferase domain